MTFKACGIIFHTKFLKSDPENALIDYNTPITLMMAFKPHLEESIIKKNFTHRFHKNKAIYFADFSQTITHVSRHVEFYI